MDLDDAVTVEIRAERAAQLLTIEELAARSGVPYSTLRRKLAGERAFGLDEIDLLATALGVGLDEIFRRAKSRQQQGATGRCVEPPRQRMQPAGGRMPDNAADAGHWVFTPAHNLRPDLRGGRVMLG